MEEVVTPKGPRLYNPNGSCHVCGAKEVLQNQLISQEILSTVTCEQCGAWRGYVTLEHYVTYQGPKAVVAPNTGGHFMCYHIYPYPEPWERDYAK